MWLNVSIIREGPISMSLGGQSPAQSPANDTKLSLGPSLVLSEI